MAIRPLNSVNGFSVSNDPQITVIDANANVTAANLTVTGTSNLGPVGNVTITGGSNGQALVTDGSGVLSFQTITTTSNRAAPMPYNIPDGESYIVNENFQGLYSQAITIDGELEVDGILIEVPISFAAETNQVLFAENGNPTGRAGFTFDFMSGNLAVPGNSTFTGNILPSANVTYNLGSPTHRWQDLYLANNTIYLGNSTISAATGNIILSSADGATLEVTGNSNVTTIVNGNSNISVNANGNVTTSVAGVANVLVVTDTGTTVAGNVAATGVKTDNLYYANGTAWNLGQDPGGSNTQIQFNNNGNFGASANFTFDTATNNLSVSGNIVSSTGAIYGNAAGLTNIPGANITGNISGNISNAAHATTANTVVDAAQPNITSVGTLTDLSVNGNAVVGGNLTVNGNLVYVNVEELSIEDPIINLQTGANGAAPVANSGKDVGTALNYYDTQARVAFMGWDTSNVEFAFGSRTTISSEVVTFDTLGNVRAQTFKGNVEATTISGNLTTASQANITTVGTLGSLAVTGNVTAGNVSGANTITANYLVSNSGCVSVNGAMIAFNSGTGAAGIFSSLATDINFGLAANVTIGSTTGTSNVRGELSVGGNATVTGNVSANLVTGTLTTAAQPNVTSVGTLTNLSVTGNVVSNVANANISQTNSIISKRSAVAVTNATVVDTFSAASYRSAKYIVSSQNDDGFESLEVLLVHNDINSFITVYGAINDNGNTVAITTGINSGNVELRATGLAANTEIKLIGTYVPVI